MNQARAHQALIDALWDFEDPTASRARFEAAATSGDEPERSILMTQVARTLGLQKRFIDAQTVLDGLADQPDELGVRVLLETGRVLNSSGAPEAARPFFEAAFAAALEAGFEHLAVDALHMVAIVAAASEQEELIRAALALAADADDPRARDWRASLLNNLGWTLFDRGDVADALTIFQDALAARVEQGKLGEIQIARWCVGRALREVGRYDEALAIQKSLAIEHAAAGTPDPFVQEELAALESAMKSEP